MTQDWKTYKDLDPSHLYVLPLGVGNAFTGRYFHSSFVLIAGGELVLVDAPAPLRRMIHDASERAGVAFDAMMIDHLLLTHLHGDHCNGVEEFAYVKKYLDDGRRPHLYLLPELLVPLWEHRLYAAMGGKNEATGEDRSLADYFQPHRIHPGTPQRLVNGPPLTVEFRRTKHSLPCAAMKFHYGRISLGYSADTPYDQGLVDWLSDCDLIIHEAAEDEAAAIHTPLSQLERLPDELKSRIRLIHYGDDLGQEDTSMRLLREGELIELAPAAARA
ncbi:MAG: MBL fold metallo-hydrolase [Candidatus Sumerlaeia bacterium]|nr:MBL fold metallo-hydrolase [Candidatus Sumerlaeia bacterium]